MRFVDFRRQKRRRLARKGFAQTDKVRRKDPAQVPAQASRRRHVFLFATVFLTVWAIATVSIIYRRSFPRYEYVEDQIARRNIYSDVPFEYVDSGKTRLHRQQAANAVPPVYRIEETAAVKTQRRLSELRESVTQGQTAHDTASPPPEESSDPTSARSKPVLRDTLSSKERLALESVASTSSKWLVLRELVTEAASDGLVAPAKLAGDLSETAVNNRVYLMDNLSRQRLVNLSDIGTPAEAAQRIAREFSRRFPENASVLTRALETVLQNVLTPNLKYSSEATQKAREQRAAQVPVVRRRVLAEQPLIRKGEPVTAEDLHMLEMHQEALRNQRSQAEVTRDAAVTALLCFVIVFISGYFLLLIRPEVVNHRSDVVMIATVLILQIVLNRVAADLYYAHGGSQYVMVSILPLALGSMLLSQLEGNRAAVLGGFFTSTVLALQHQGVLELFLIGGTSCFVAAVLMSRARRRYLTFRAGLGAGATVFLMNTLFLLQDLGPQPAVLQSLVPETLLLALATGVLSSIAASALLPVFEYLFGVTTDMSLLELSDLNHPLLKRLQMEAPGTYHHSLMVANLAEQASEAIGANPLLARVCAYFHDIGKLQHPDYFSENIWDRDPHQQLQPRMSTMVILNHVKEGIEFGLKYKLKKPIREAIAQHHGTSLVYYFYHRARSQQDRKAEKRKDERGSNNPVGEQEYRYPGPLPARREIAIISIADACEAASRSLDKPTPRRIADLVDNLVMKRVREGQLDHANLTFRELNVVKETIIRVLGTMMHGRVKYPSEQERDEAETVQTPPGNGTEKPSPAGKSDTEGDAPDPSGAGR